MARVAMIVSNPCTADARVIKMARAARDAGHEVHVFATRSADTPPYDNSTSITYHRLEWRPAAHIIDRSPLKWLPRVLRPLTTWIAVLLTPYLKYKAFSEVFAGYVAEVRPDIIHAHDLICLRAGVDAAALSGAKLIYDAHELEVHRNPPLPFWLKWFVAGVERRNAREAFTVNTVGRLVAGELSKHLGRQDINVLYNSPPLDPCIRHIRAELGLAADRPLVVYVGKVAVGRGVSELLSLLPKLPGFTFATVGPCDARQRLTLTRQAERNGVADRFRILPPVPFEQVVDYIAGADVGVISVEPVTLSYQYCMPNKLFEMSFANVPIIANQLDEIVEFLAENGNGRIVDFEDPAAVVYSLARMVVDKDSYLMDGPARARLAEKYSWEAQGRKLTAIYEAALAT